jgi:Transposase, Mutator family
MLDGVHFGEHVCVLALGIGIDGTKHPLALVDGDTENTTVVSDLLVWLRERGLDTTGPILVVIDGAKALRVMNDPASINNRRSRVSRRQAPPDLLLTAVATAAALPGRSTTPATLSTRTPARANDDPLSTTSLRV